jgi:arginyl-tRNA synthetase
MSKFIRQSSITGYMNFQAQITALLKHAGIPDPAVETPPNPALGDFAFPCFTLAKERKQAPRKATARRVPGKSNRYRPICEFFHQAFG